MKEILLILFLEIDYILTEELNGVYNIKGFDTNIILTEIMNILSFRPYKIKKMQSFRIIPFNSELYIIESVRAGKKLGLNKRGDLSLINNKNPTQYWNIINLNNSGFLIKNNSTKKFLQFQKFSARRSEILEDNKINNNTQKIDNSFKFSLFKLYQEVELKPEYNKFIEEEPVDVLIKYIDLTDKNLNRKDIKQITKDEDHGELRYCIRSVMDNIPWIRKIFILMPNEKVSFLKSFEEIKDKIVYVKDKDVLGHDSANICAFHLALFNLSRFGMADNFILMDDDYFIGKPINKNKFFYYDENEKKVVPNLVSDEFRELNKDEVNREYNKLYIRRDKIDPHTCDGWKFHTFSVYKLLLDNFEFPLVDGGFTHNAISLNLKDLKEISDFVKEKYQYYNISQYSKTRPIFSLQAQTLFNTYLLNVKKRRVNTIPRIFIDLKGLKSLNDLNIELFVINVSGENSYKKEEFDKEKNILESKYNRPTPYEIINNR